MKRFLVIVLMTICGIYTLSAQNLVPNPSFECGLFSCDLLRFPDMFGSYVCSWYSPNYATPDIYSTQIPNKGCSASMPDDNYLAYNKVGTQRPRTGSMFAGMITYSDNRIDNGYMEYREYIQVRLDSSLAIGEYYCAEMYVSFAEGSGYSSNNLGMYLHSSSLRNYQNSYMWISSPHVLEKDIIEEATKWVRVNNYLVADSAYQYVTIGNFFSNINSNHIKKEYAKKFERFAYYFIDDISVERIEEQSISFSGNTTICEGETANISIGNSWEEMLWTNLSDTLDIISRKQIMSVSPEHTTSYLVRAINCKYRVRDTLTIEVLPRPKPVQLENQVICKGVSIQLDAGEGYDTYLWSNDSTSQFLDVEEEGIYSVWVSNEFGCKEIEVFQIYTIEPPEVNLGYDTLLCGDFFPLHAGATGQYEWSTGSIESSITPTEAGIYWVTVTNQCGYATDSINIYSIHDTFIPNVLTVNADERNEKFLIKGIGAEYSSSLRIYNRWGELIFIDQDYHGSWPPKGSDLPAGTLFYTLNVAGCKDYKGILHIIN